MEAANVQTVRAGYDALARGDIEGVLAQLDPEFVAEDHERTLEETRVYHGREGFVQLFASANEGFEDVRYEPLELEDHGERVFVTVRRTGRGSASGVAVEERQFHIFDLRDGRVTRFRSFLDQAEAARALAED